MTDDEIRALVRAAIARHLGGGSSFPATTTSVPASSQPSNELRHDPPWRSHASFGKFLVSRGDEEGGPCLIEPAVHCNHCGFCQSYGH
jgi:hypothetical protein